MLVYETFKYELHVEFSDGLKETVKIFIER